MQWDCLLVRVVKHFLTGRKMKAKEQQKLEESVYELTENIPVGVYTIVLKPGNETARFSFVSKRFLELADVSQEEVLANINNAFKNVHPDDLEEWLRLNQLAFSRRAPFRGECRGLMNGEVRWFSAESLPRELADGTVVWEGVLTDITERKRVEEELQGANAALADALAEARQMAVRAEAASNAKNEFIASMSHEIRTPMNAILGFADVLTGELQDPRHREHAAIIVRSSQALLHLISELLDLSQIESGRMDLRPARCGLSMVLNDLKTEYSARAEEKGLYLNVVAEDLPEFVLLDALRLRQVLVNLVGNAIKFTDTGGVEIRATATGSGDAAEPTVDLCIQVRDTGIGVADKDKERIFGAFEQAQGHDLNRYSGAGLGLAIAQRVARLMNGQVTVTDSPAGAGAVFTVLLKGVPEVVAEEGSGFDLHLQGGQVKFAGRPKVLVVDDVATNRELLKLYLANLGCVCSVAGSGEEALNLFATFQPAVVLADLRMPAMSVQELAAELRRRHAEREADAGPAPVIIAVTAKDQPEGEQFDAILIKPVAQNDLARTLSRFIAHTVKLAPDSSGEDAAGMVIDPQSMRACLDYDLQMDIAYAEKTLRVKHVRYLGVRIEAAGIKGECPALIGLGRELINAADAFQVERIKALLQMLNGYLDAE
jgi:two-component system, sensor histidine kinase and response regulator